MSSDALPGRMRFAFRAGWILLSTVIAIELDIPDDLSRFRLPPGVNSRLQELLDRQDQGTPLSLAERQQAEGLVELSELLSLIKLRAERASHLAHDSRLATLQIACVPGREPRWESMRVLPLEPRGTGSELSYRSHHAQSLAWVDRAG